MRIYGREKGVVLMLSHPFSSQAGPPLSAGGVSNSSFVGRLVPLLIELAIIPLFAIACLTRCRLTETFDISRLLLFLVD